MSDNQDDQTADDDLWGACACALGTGITGVPPIVVAGVSLASPRALGVVIWALLLLALWALAGPALSKVFTDSIARVTGEIGG